MFYKKPSNYIIFNNDFIYYNNSFNVIFNCLDILDHELFEQGEKTNLMYNLFQIKEKNYTLHEKNYIIDKIFIDVFGEKTEATGKATNNKSFDFKQDSDLIFASFMKEYQINLYNELNKLSFKEFLILLQNLSEDTVFKKVIEIRTMKIPQRTNSNKDEISKILELKAKYKLINTDSKNTNAFQSGINDLFNILKSR